MWSRLRPVQLRDAMLSEPTSTTVFRRRSDVRFRVIDGEAVVILQGPAEILGLNPVGTRLLELIDASTPVVGLLDRLAGEYDVGPDRLARDVIAFLGELTSCGLIEPVAEAPAP